MSITRAPAATSYSLSSKSPVMTHTPKGTIVTHRELFDQMQTSNSLTPSFGYDVVNYWTLNPGNASLFPWLSHVALAYEFYQFRNLRFVYVPRTGTSTAGVAVLAIEPDADDLVTDLDIPATSLTARQWMTSMQSTVEGSLWNAITLTVPSSILSKFPQRHTRSLEAHDHTVDPRTADIGKFIGALFGGPQNTWAGDLFVEYTVELSVPQMSLESDGAPTAEAEMTLLGQGNPVSGATYMSNRFPIGTYQGVDSVTPVWNGLPAALQFVGATNTANNALKANSDVKFDADVWTLTARTAASLLGGQTNVQVQENTVTAPSWISSDPSGTATAGSSTAAVIDPTYEKNVNVGPDTNLLVSFSRFAADLKSGSALRFYRALDSDVPSLMTHISTHRSTGLRSPITSLMGQDNLDFNKIAHLVPGPIMVALDQYKRDAAERLAASALAKSPSGDCCKPAAGIRPVDRPSYR